MVEAPGRPANLFAWKMTFQEAYAAKRRAEAAREGEGKTFGGSTIFGAAPEKKANEQLQRRGHKKSRASPAHKSDDGLAGGILRQYCYGGHTDGCKKRATRGVSG